MVGIKSIEEAGNALQESALQLVMLVDAFVQLAGDNEPSWLFLVNNRMADLDVAVRTYVERVNEGAMPLLRDVSSLTR